MSKKTDPKSSFHQLTWYASGDMLAAIVVGTGLGWGLEQYAPCHPWGMIGGFLLGATAGLRNVYRMLKKCGYEISWPKKDH